MMKSIPVMLSVLLLAATFASAQTPDIHTLHPPPKSAFTRSGYFSLGMNTVIVTPDVYDPVTQSAAVYLQTRVKEMMGYTLSIVPVANYSGSGGAVLLGVEDSYPLLTSQLRAAMPRGETMPDSGGYILDISESFVLIAGADPDGIFSGVATLAQLIQPGNVVARIECAHIRDYPDYPIRWIFSQHNLLVTGNLASLRSIADTMAAYKLNGVQQNDFKYNILGLMGVNYFDNVEVLKNDLALRNIEMIPGVANIGWSDGILYNDPNLAEGLPAVASYVMESDTGRLIPDPRVTLPNGDFESVDANEKFTGWSFYDGPGISTFPDRSIHHGGSVSARCTDFAAGNAAGNCRFNRRVDCQPYHYYTMSAWLRTENFKGDLVQLLAIGQDDNGDSRSLTSMSISVPATTNGWMKVGVVFNTVGYNHVQLYAGVWGGKSGTIWWDDFAVKEAGLTNVLRREGTPLRVRNPKTGATYREGIDYAPVVDPKLEAGHGTYGPYHQPPTLRRLPGGIIANGDTLTVSFYHPIAAVSDAEGNGSTMVCVSEDTLYSILGDQIRRVNQLYQPDRFFMGHDEVRTMNWDSACLRRNMTPGELLADNLRRCDSIIQHVHPGAESFVWSDMFDSLHNAHDRYYMVNGDLASDWDLIPKSVRIVNWNGGAANRDKSLRFFADHGFRQVTSPYYDVKNTSNMRAWRLSQQAVSGVEGMMYTTWSADYSFLRPFAYYAWGAGPYIIHTPLDSNLVSTTKPGDSVLIEATIYPDPYDPSDTIRSAVAQIIGYGPSQIQEGVQLVRASGNRFVGYAHAISSTLPFGYTVSATNAQGLSHTTPEYRYGGVVSGVSEEQVTRRSIVIAPNPVKSSAVVSFTVPRAGAWRLRLVDLLGREVFSTAGEAALPGETRVTIDASAFASGEYRCQIAVPGGMISTMMPIIR